MAKKKNHHVKLQATVFLDDLRSIEWIVLMGDDKTFADVPAFHYSFLIRLGRFWEDRCLLLLLGFLRKACRQCYTGLEERPEIFQPIRLASSLEEEQ